MNKYLVTLNEEIRNYLKILSPEFPEWLLEYIYTPEMLKLDGIGMSCGTLYTKVYNDKYFYSSLTHSVAVALIIWHFTHDKKQTISGLFHDIATPTFKHCIDFMNGDSENQESTEERTEQIIRNSKEIMALLKRDSIKVEEVSDYHIYPIADNDTPRLSADRFEYTLSGGLYQVRVFELKDIERYYNNIVILKNEDGIDELVFNDAKLCENFIHNISKLWPRWVEDEDRLCMQFIADIVKSMNIKNYITVDDLYKFSEKEVLQLIQNCEDNYIRNAFKNFQNATRDSVYKSDEPNNEIYCTSVKGKKRYINPLVNLENKVSRIKDVSLIANDDINNFLNMKNHKFTSETPMGIGGIKYSFLNMYSIFGDSVIKKFTSNVAKAYNLFPRKGVLLPGADADIVIFDDSVTDTIKDNTSLYNGREVRGKIVKVYLGGNCVVNNGKYISSRGKYIKR